MPKKIGDIDVPDKLWDSLVRGWAFECAKQFLRASRDDLDHEPTPEEHQFYSLRIIRDFAPEPRQLDSLRYSLQKLAIRGINLSVSQRSLEKVVRKQLGDFMSPRTTICESTYFTAVNEAAKSLAVSITFNALFDAKHLRGVVDAHLEKDKQQSSTLPS